MASDQMQFDEVVEESKNLRGALDVCGFTVHYLSLFLDQQTRDFAASQIAAAHEAYREATGEDSWDQMISERIARREDARREERDQQCNK